MPGNVPSFNTIYEKPVVLPPKSEYGRNVILLGLSESGPYNNPTYVGTMKEAQALFTSGPLVTAFEETYETGCRNVYLVRLTDLTPQSFLSAFEVLSDYAVHILVPIGIYFDDIENYAPLFIKFCSDRKDFGESIAVMSVKPFDAGDTITSQALDDRVAELYQSQRARQGFGEEGYYLSVVAGEFLVFGNSAKARYTPGATIYAGLLSLLKPGQSPVNKRLLPVSRLRYSLVSSSRTETVTLSTGPTVLKRRPIEGTVVVTSTSSTPETYLEDHDFSVDYQLGTISAKDTAGEALVTYRYDDYDSLASVGFVPPMNFVKNGAVFGASVTMSKNTISMVQDIRVMQSIAAHIRDVGSEFIGETNITLTYLDSYIDDYLAHLVSTYQIADGEHFILRENGGRDLSIEVTIQPRESVRAQTFRVQLPTA